ncbi:MAG: hypothetical protein WC467_00545 [Patescibacteria group bacterium]
MKQKPIEVKKFYKFLTSKIKTYLDPDEGLIIFPYYNTLSDVGGKVQMAHALIFWDYIHDTLINKMSLTPKELREFFLIFLKENYAQKNPLIQIIIMVESLPTSVWRKLIWRENIDMMSYESFLRRLTTQQIQAIKDNYNDLFPQTGEPVVSRVFKKSLRDRLKILFGTVTVTKLLQEDYCAEKRNQTKGAWAFSLLSLDFGFSLYPKGSNNDSKITNKSFTRFLSIKEHINDFIVNQEDGKYWWLYRTVRSNYAFFPKKEVILKDHICPGFWMTLIMQTLFWIVSPIALISTASVIQQSGFSALALIPAAFALPMISWAYVAIVRLIVNLLILWGKKSKSLKILIKIILTPIALVVAIAIIGGLVLLLVSIFTFLAAQVGFLLTTMFMLSALFYIFFFVTCVAPESNNNDGLFDYDDIPSFVRFLLHLSIGAPIIVLFDKYLTLPIVKFIVSVAKSFWTWYTDNLLLSNWFIFTLLFSLLFVYLVNLFLNNESKFIKFEKILNRLAKGFLVLTVIVFGILFWKIGEFDFTAFGVLPILFFPLVILIFSFSLLMSNIANASNIEKREQAFDFFYKMDRKMGNLGYKSHISLFLNSQWLGQLENQARWEIICQIDYLAFFFFPNERDLRVNFSELLIKKGSQEKIDLLSENMGKIIKAGNNRDYRMELIGEIVAGLSVEDAKDVINSREIKKNIIWENITNVFKIMLWPFAYCWQGITWTGKKIKEFFLTLKDLWELFNKVCPYVSKPELLK